MRSVLFFMTNSAPGIYIARGTEHGGFKAFAIGEGLLNMDLSHQVWGGSGDDGDYESIAASVSWLWACYRIRADKMSNLPLSIVSIADDEPVEENELPFNISISDLLWRTEYSLLVHGFAYWMKVLSSQKTMRFDSIAKVDGEFRMKLAEDVTSALYNVRWLDPLSMTPLVNEADGLYAFKRSLKNDKKIYRVNKDTGYFDELVYFWLPGLREAAPGFGISSVVQNAAAVLQNIDRYSGSFFEQGGMPITLLTMPKNTHDEQRRKLESRFERFATGVKNAFKPIAIKGDVKVERLGLNPGEVGMPPLEEAKRDAILASTGVPISVLIGKAANFATSKQDAKNLIQNVIQPRSKIIEKIINTQLFEPLGYRLSFRTDSMPEMKQDEREAARAVKDLTQAGITPEAALFFLGYDLALPDGVSLTQAVEPDTPEEEPEPDDDMRALTVEDMARWQRKALKAFKRGDSPSVAFTSEHISEAVAREIRERLTIAITEREVRAAFVASPFRQPAPAFIQFENYP